MVRMDEGGVDKVPFDSATYVQRSLEGPCFVCAILGGNPDYPHHDVYESEATIAFLVRFPMLLAQCVVAPKRHVESWIADLDEGEFLELQREVRRVGVAIAATVPTERMYLLSLGSREGNAHVHFQLAPLPPGVPYRDQQLHALLSERGVLDVDDASQAALATRIRRNLE